MDVDLLQKLTPKKINQIVKSCIVLPSSIEYVHCFALYFNVGWYRDCCGETFQAVWNSASVGWFRLYRTTKSSGWISGVNGAGKTTTMRILSTALQPTSGTVTIGGCNVVEQPEKFVICLDYLPEKPPLYPQLSIGQYLAFLGRFSTII